ncbi:formate dehydrogenase accessory sulfurtransferase FdhD [Pseudokineococcus basanitobsidens]|uniref:Sulfur carrier protein FdhD n=1 Tax=Pseudokineococcus basanitobsidens TaxID=1926649 RepID=A0ABU8RKR8_9ACTN
MVPPAAGQSPAGGSGAVEVVRLRVDGGEPAREPRPDSVAVEEPLEVRVAGAAVVVTMRTPGHDDDLALGFLLTEGLLPGPSAVARTTACVDEGVDGEPLVGSLELALADGVPVPDLEGRRTFGMTSACGVCGSASVDAVRARTGANLWRDDVVVDAAVLAGLPDRLREAQRVFARTGGLHAAGLAGADGELLVVREDVGRHNAVDKVLGWAAREVGWPLTGHVLVVSGRASFELAQKAWMAGVPVLAAVSAPSSLAVQLAREAGMTLAGFVRPPTLNLYAGAHRVRVHGLAGDE